MAAPTLLTINDLAKSYGSEEIFRGVSFQLADRDHVALVGVNGAGKSTILRIVAGMEDPTAGSMVFSAGLQVTYLPQEARFDSTRTVRDEARLAFAPVLAAAERMREIELQMAIAADTEIDRILHEYDRLQTRFEAHGGYDVEHRTDEVLHGLGFSFEQFDQPVNQLSGGQKTRVALAKALLADPDLLLLDEPTNHLDLDMLEWLEGFLRGWGGACMVVSHDRYFLDRVTTRTLEVTFGRLEDYPGPYSRYLKLREERTSRRVKEYEEQQEFIARTEEFIRKYKAGQRSREARGRQTRLERMERLERPREHQELNINLRPAVRSGRIVLSTTPLQVGFAAAASNGDRTISTLVQTPELTIESRDRVALVGPNGSGKTTLLRTLVGELPPLKGRYQLGANVKLGYYAQAHDQLAREGTPFSTIIHAAPMGEETARTYLGRFLFSGDDVYKPVSGLSGGERSRLALALLLLQHANFLVLDEPTNHLDISAREALEEMLSEFEGTILFVSHDRYFIDRIATRVWAIHDNEFRMFLGNYTDYQRQIGRRPDSAQKAPQPPSPAPDPPSLDGRERRGGGDDARVQKSLSQVERDIAQLESKLNEVSDALTVASIDEDVDAVARLGAEYERLQTDLEDAYARWEELTAQLEAIAR